MLPSPVFNSYIQDPLWMPSPGSIQEVGYFDTFSCSNFFWGVSGVSFSQVWPSPAWLISSGQHLQWLVQGVNMCLELG